MKKDVFILNAVATGYYSNPSLVGVIREMLPSNVLFFVTRSEAETIAFLETLDPSQIRYFIILGGDGVFGTVLNWAVPIPVKVRPIIVPLGGGNVCYMTSFVGFRPRDPVRNLRELLNGDYENNVKIWHPVKVHIVHSDVVFYCAVFGNGLLYDFLNWMDDKNRKAGVAVYWMILKSIGLALVSTTNEAGILKGTSGKVKIGSGRIPVDEYLSLLVGTVPVLSLGSRPFRGERRFDEIWSVAYWGSYKQMFSLLPSMWFGRVPFWAKTYLHNGPTTKIVIETTDDRYMRDGSPYTVDSRFALVNDGVIEFVITAGEPVSLLFAN